MCHESNDAHGGSSDRAQREHEPRVPEAVEIRRLREEIQDLKSAINSGGEPRSALELVKARYALGEITKAEFEELIANLA